MKHTVHVPVNVLRTKEDITDTKCAVCGKIMAINTNYGDVT